MPAAVSKVEDVHDDRHAVSWSAAALLVALWAGIPWLASAAAAIPVTLRRRGHHDPPRSSLVWRWAATVFFIGTVMSALAAERATRAIPSAAWARDAARAWLGGSADAFPSLLVMLVVAVAFAGLTRVSRGLAGPIMLAEAMLSAAVFASVVYAHAFNLFPATIAAIPPWTIVFIVGLCAVMAPLATRGARSFTRTRGAKDPGVRRSLAVGAGIIVLAFALRLALAPVITRAALHLTLP